MDIRATGYGDNHHFKDAWPQQGQVQAVGVGGQAARDPRALQSSWRHLQGHRRIDPRIVLPLRAAHGTAPEGEKRIGAPRLGQCRGGRGRRRGQRALAVRAWHGHDAHGAIATSDGDAPAVMCKVETVDALGQFHHGER